jgi:uncharacterized protein (DUF885 family)
MVKAAAIVALALTAVGCQKNTATEFAGLSDEFVDTTLALSPSGATAAGLHMFKGRNLDDQLDDLRPANLDKQRHFYEAFRESLNRLGASKLSAEDRADLSIMQDQISLALLDLTETQSSLHNPDAYVEILGNALFSPYVLLYGPPAKRFGNIIARLQKTPLFLEQASANLVSSPAIWTQVAMDENEGNINLVDRILRDAAPAELKEAFANAAKPALEAMRKFQSYLKDSLSKRDNYEWRLGRDRYARKFRYTLESGVEADDTLQTAEKALSEVRAHMLKLALPLHRAMEPAHGEHAELSGEERQNRVIGEVLSKIADRHSTPESYMDDARRDLAEATQFVASSGILALPKRSNLQVVPTPEFMRGTYSVGGFAPAPALEPQLGAFYWVTPIPADWPKARVESKLREYNFYKLKLLTLHEAMPGHYVQFEYANDVQPRSRRVLRSVYGNGPYIEGWAQFAEQQMLDQGFPDHSPEMALTFAKEELRVLANAILDIRLHTLGMQDQEALDLMEKETFQEREEAVEKLQRAKLSSCQLPTYFVGWRGWQAARDHYKSSKGASFTAADFNERALKQGAVPIAVLGQLLK